MSTTTSLVDFSLNNVTTSKADSFSYPITAIPSDVVNIFEVFTDVISIPSQLFEAFCQPLTSSFNYSRPEKIVLSDEDYVKFIAHIESDEPVENPNLKKLFTRFNK